MALTYDLSDCVDYKSLQTDEEWRATQALIFSAMYIGIGDWKPEKEKEIFSRISFWEKLFGTLLIDGNRKDVPITVEAIHKRIGLKTNVFPEETRAKWLKRVTENFFKDRSWDFDHSRVEEKELVNA